MFQFYLNYPDTLDHEQQRRIIGMLRSNIHEWLCTYNVIIANISVQYREKELPTRVDHEFITTFDLELECYGGPDPTYCNTCKNKIAKFDQDIVVDRKYADYFEIGGMLPNAYYLKEE